MLTAPARIEPLARVEVAVQELDQRRVPLLLPLERGQPVALRVAQELVVVAQAIGVHGLAHRTVRL